MKIREFSLPAAAAASIAIVSALLSGCEQAASQPQGRVPPEVAVVAVQAQSVPAAFEYVGQIAGSREVEVRARVTGIVLKRNYREGRPVAQGQSMFTIDPAPFEVAVARAEAALASADARFAQTRRNSARLKPLFEAKAASQKDYDDAASAEQIAQAEVKTARANLADARLNIGYTRVEAPVSGIAGRALRSEGTYVSGPDVLLTTVSQIDPIYVLFGVSDEERLKLARETDAGRLTLPKDGQFEVSVKLAGGSVHGNAGKRNFSDVRVSGNTGTSEARAELPNPGGLLHPGQFVRVTLKGAQRPGAIMVPQRAVLEGPKGKFVYVVNSESKAEPRPVELGDWQGNAWIVTAGLNPGDKVIVDGVMKIGPGAPVMEQTVAAPLENATTGAERMIYMSSPPPSNGTVQTQVTSDIGTDVDRAAVNINNRVRQVEPRLPQDVRRLGVTVEKSSSSFLMVAAFYSPESRYDSLYISNFVAMNVLDVVKRIPGTTNVQIFGAKDYAMRIWVRPDRLTQLRLTTADLVAALNEQNAQFAAGKVGQTPTGGPQELVYTVTTKGRLADPGEFENVIVRANPDGSTLRLRDVARIELGSKDYEFIGRVNGKEAVLVGVFLQPGANALEVSKSVKNAIRTLSARFPDGLIYSVPYDTTRFVEVSIREVLKTLAEAMALVFLVVFLFLQNWRATLIPFAAVPVSLIGTFAGLYLLGYSINTLTLFGMVLAIGIVVDDAIVVLENVERIMHEEHLEAREAAVKAMKEVTKPVVAIVLVLCAVFVPIAFLGGLAGELYRQFAVTISIAVVISGTVALTLTPSLCVLILKRGHKQPGRFFEWFNDWFRRVTGRYADGVAWMLRRGGIGVALFAGMVALAAGLWRVTPGRLVPEEDQGWFITAVILPDGATLERTDRVVAEVVEAIRSNPANENAIAFTGFDFIGGGYRHNAATIVVTPKDWDR